MISVPLAVRLRDAGLRWEPARGDRFVIADRGMDADVFVLSDMTVDLHEYAGSSVIGFNGTVEWALDSVEKDSALWLPAEGQLRDRLGGAFVALTHDAGNYLVEVAVNGLRASFASPDPEEAYGQALLFLITGDAAEAQNS